MPRTQRAKATSPAEGLVDALIILPALGLGCWLHTSASMAEAAGGKGQRKLANVLLTCFCASACRKEQVQLPPTDGDDIEEGRRRRRPSTAVASNEKPLQKIADAFKELADVVSSESSNVEVAAFARACSLVSPLFGCLGIQFKFAEMDYVSKDVQTNSVRKVGSHSRNLLRIKRGLDFLRVLFEQILLTEGNSIRDPFSKAYAQIFNSYHGWALRKAVSARLPTLPTRHQICRKFNEDESSARVQMQTYVMASPPLLQYIDEIFLSRELGIDW